MKKALDAQVLPFPKGSSLDHARLTHQRKLAHAFMDFIGNDAAAAVLDMHLSAAKFSGTSEHTLQALMEDRHETPASSTMEHHGKKLWNTRTVKWEPVSGGTRLPYQDGEFDWVFCNSVIEHAGNFEQQQALLSELWRIARKGVFVTASNKKHPVEFNTGLPVLHWLPRGLWKMSLNWLGKGAWQDRLPNLLDARALGKLAKTLPGDPAYDIGHVRMAGIKAQFFLMLEKQS